MNGNHAGALHEETHGDSTTGVSSSNEQTVNSPTEVRTNDNGTIAHEDAERYDDGVELLQHSKSAGGIEEPELFPGTSIAHQISYSLGVGAKPERTVGAIGLAFVAFVSVCGGPFGIEDAVGAAGPLITLISLLVLGVFWALPQALMTAELSTIYDENGGYIVWVYEALGPFWGFVNGVNSVASNLCDLPLYPVLYSTYLARYFHFGTTLEWVVKAISLLLVVILNILGMEAVADSSLLFTIAVLLPFIIEPFFEAPDPSGWGETPSGGADWAVFMSVVLWNFQGWDSMGCIAGEVKSAKKSYPLGVSLATVLIIFNYAVPIMVGLAIEPEWAKWGTDSDQIDLIDVAKKVSNWIGIWVVFGASFAVLGEFNAVVSSSSRALQRMAQYRMVPKFLVKNRTRFSTPVPAILFEAVTTAVLMMFDFSSLVVLDTFFNNVSLVLEVIAFLRLKHQYPDMPRPYAVPGRVKGAWAISIPKFLVIGYAWYSIGWSIHLLAGVVVNLFGLIFGYWWAFRYLPRLERSHARQLSREGLNEFDGPFGVDHERSEEQDSLPAAGIPERNGGEAVLPQGEPEVTAPFDANHNLLGKHTDRTSEESRRTTDAVDAISSPSASRTPSYDRPLLGQASSSSLNTGTDATSPEKRRPNSTYGSFR